MELLNKKIRQSVADHKHYEKRKMENLCGQCGMPNTPESVLCAICRQRRNINSKIQYIELKNDIIAHYGGKCVCCGELEYYFLGVDHINNNGAEERRTTKNGTGVIFYHWLKKNNYPNGYQILCHSCNQGKQSNKGTCPHQHFNVFDRNTYVNTF